MLFEISPAENWLRYIVGMLVGFIFVTFWMLTVLGVFSGKSMPNISRDPIRCLFLIFGGMFQAILLFVVWISVAEYFDAKTCIENKCYDCVSGGFKIAEYATGKNWKRLEIEGKKFELRAGCLYFTDVNLDLFDNIKNIEVCYKGDNILLVKKI